MHGELSPGDRERLDRLYARFDEHRRHHVGYPVNFDFDYSELFRFLAFPINNVGDPFGPGTYAVHSRDFEREVIAFFAELLKAPADGYWGYVTNGGTEGNLYGLYLARELCPEGVVYWSEDTHYSVAKNLRLLRMRNIMIRSQPSGDIDYADLREAIRIHRDVPPIIFANIGTTMREGHCDLSRVRRIFKELAIHTHYIHCDAALCGLTLPFLEGSPPFDFAAGADSISISGHKLIGSPLPCGIVVARKSNVDRIARSIEYIGALDTTLSGSRNGFSPLILWYAIRRLGREGFRRRVVRCRELALYAEGRLRRAGFDAWSNPFAITVVFPRPTDALRERWQLAVQDDIAHLIAMPHLDEARIDQFVEDLERDRAARRPEETVASEMARRSHGTSASEADGGEDDEP